MSGEVTTAGLRLARRLLNRKFRSTAGEFLVEGPQAVREAVRCGRARQVLATAEAARLYPDLAVGQWVRLAPGQVRDLTDTVTSQGIFAICPALDCSLDQALAGPARLLVICAQVRDPGNLGTVIRCADAFGADAVVVTSGSVDPTNPKTVRASVGSIFHLPVVAGVDLASAVATARAKGFTVLATDATGADLNSLAASGGLDGKVAWVMGNEAWGLPAQDSALSDQVVRIPMWGQAESLNLSTASAICLYATASRHHQ